MDIIFVASCLFFFRTKKFVRWKNGSCLEAEAVQVPSVDEPVIFSYFTDVSNHIKILEHAQSVQETIKQGIGSLVRQAHYWKRYRALWKMQRVRNYSIYSS